MAAPVVDSRIVTPTVPTLFQSALVKVALPLLNDFGSELKVAFRSLKEPRNSANRNAQGTIVDEAMKKLLLIPPLLRVRVMEAVHGLECEIWEWKMEHPDLRYQGDPMVDPRRSLIWRSDGSIDRIKTARQLVVNTNIDIRSRFHFACLYCLEDSVQTLWAELEASGKTGYFTSDPELFRYTMVPFWIGRIRDGSQIPWVQAAVEYIDSSRTNWKPEVGFSGFFSLLHREDRGKFLSFLMSPTFDEDLRFCLYAMTPEEHDQVLKMCAGKVLESYSEWPLRNLFFRAAEKLWHYINKNSFCDLIYHILDQMPPLEDLEDFEYCKFVEQVWNMSTDHFREEAMKFKYIRQKINLCLCETGIKRKTEDEIIKESKKRRK